MHISKTVKALWELHNAITIELHICTCLSFTCMHTTAQQCTLDTTVVNNTIKCSQGMMISLFQSIDLQCIQPAKLVPCLYTHTHMTYADITILYSTCYSGIVQLYIYVTLSLPARYMYTVRTYSPLRLNPMLSQYALYICYIM